MKVSLTLALFCAGLCSGAFAGEIELKITLSKNTFFQDETITAGIHIVNMSTATISVPEPVEGVNVWLEIRDSSGAYVSTRPINIRKDTSKESAALQSGRQLPIKIDFAAQVKSPVIPVKSTSAVASVGERLRDRLSGVNLKPGYYFVHAVFLSAPESVSAGGTGLAVGDPAFAVMSKKEQIYVKRRE